MVATVQDFQFDAIVIGSGIGGLTVAALLAKLHRQRVLVLEQHFKVGGFTHGFERRGKFHWDVGLHYVGDMGSGSTGRAVFDFLTNGQLDWQPMPDPFETFVYPDFAFSVAAEPQRYQADLIAKFPQEAKAIQRYFRDVQRAAVWFGAHTMVDLLPTWLAPVARPGIRALGRMARQTTHHYLDQHFRDRRLKALLASQWSDYGMPPAQSCFGIHSVIVTHYLNGGWYPVGGGPAIAAAIAPVIEQAGGVILTQQRVTEIVLKGDTAVGVRAQSPARPDEESQTFRAPLIISDAGAVNTYLKLIPASYPLPARRAIQTFPRGSSALTLYLGLNQSPQTLGFEGENHWIYTAYDHNAMAQATPLTGDPAHPWPQFAYLSFPSLKDPLAQTHTAEIIALVGYEGFSRWRQQSWRHRDADYQALKATITEALLELVEAHYPGFTELIDYAELSTPLTLEHFDASDQGAIYGVPGIPERLDQDWISARTPIKQLYLTGADSLSPGIMGALMGGVKTAGLVVGPLGFFKTMAAIMSAAKGSMSSSGQHSSRSQVSPISVDSH